MRISSETQPYIIGLSLKLVSMAALTTTQCGMSILKSSIIPKRNLLALNPKPKSSILSPRPSTLNPKTETLNPRS